MTRNSDIFQEAKIFHAMAMAKLILVILLKEQKRLEKLLESLAHFRFFIPDCRPAGRFFEIIDESMSCCNICPPNLFNKHL